MNAIEARDLSKHYRDVAAIDEVSISLEENRVHGLLGRNGAGKTTLMKLLTAQIFASSGSMQVLGEDPVENAGVLSRTCFIQESQKYPDGFRPRDVLRIAQKLYPAWDQGLAADLVADFRLPEKRAIRKLSRGQLSAVGIIIGLASRAPLTFFDEPYLGLDAVARRLFFDRLLADYAEHPRTIVLSTHHIDEVSNLLEHVVLLDQGRVMLDEEADALQGAAIEVSGRLAEVEEFTARSEVLHEARIGALATATILTDGETTAAAARAAGLDVAPVSLQNYIVHRTTAAAPAAAR
ncbi:MULTISPECIES: ABC transporter ATP-binding protein [Brachybacterium]|uniref:ABC transporter ATP-binding protein n=1 Tax=Brachybacterium TaxID=43668 RepID=UPI000BB7AF59|nr:MULTISPECIES: ABC transporter ATP-binding protein [Brachybacterium]PCC34612.1 ABC transporter ATP-binding protein [Brachybacterium alimentarium]RCS65716.1 ABC transporter ATP-binding protein [Brachybacterium sp. JB7]RCS67326.1 ABC transporter ATP-binding protein [Brachybacterium alimentarium]RCS77166.1 ABC transporter ATP-binding protein [Brachybacterium alimentarium]RCS80747.1 ABC transporter ATP-binding protein [Brachybacterium alimentarium]